MPGGKRWGFEIKRADAPTPTRGMHIARQDLQLQRLEVVHAGSGSFPLAEGIDAVALTDLWKRVHRS